MALITHNSFLDNPLIPIPLHDRLNNQHLYTCRKEGKREPLICEPLISSISNGSKPISDRNNLFHSSTLQEYGYAFRGVFDSSRKTDLDWSLRRFDSIVGYQFICSASNLFCPILIYC